jgi:hypothetical protein
VSVAEIGHNRPPEPTPFEAVKVHIEDLWTEACNWADGAKIENQQQADAVAKLIEDFRQAHAAADEARKAENKPFDDGKAAVQAKFAPLIADTKGQQGLTVKAMAALKATLTPWLLKIEQQKRAAEQAAREEAERKAREAAEAMRSADAANLAERDAAEQKVIEANIADAAAKFAANDKAHAKGDGRAIGLRRSYRPILTDRKAALMHYAASRPDELVSFLCQLAETDVREGKRQIPGFDVIEEARVA